MLTDRDSLIRKEVLEARKQRLFGQVLLPQSLKSWVLTSFHVVIASLIVTLVGLGSYSEVQHAPGYLLPDEGLIKLYPATAGSLREVYVRNGQSVSKDQDIALVVTDTLSESGEIHGQRSREELERQIELMQQTVSSRQTIAQNSRARLDVEREALSASIERLTQQLDLQREITQASKHALDQAETLLGDGYISNVDVENRRESWLLSRQTEQSIADKIGEANSRIQLVNLQRLELPEKQQLERLELESQISELRAELFRLSEKSTFLIRAPTAGRITNLSTKAGALLAVNQPLASILPASTTVHAEIYIPSRAAGFVKAGNPVKLSYSGFPERTFGTFKGTIAQVDEFILNPSDVDTPLSIEGPFYRAQVSIDQQYVVKGDQQYALQPGMLLTAKIVVEQTGFLDWLFGPHLALGTG